MLQRKSAQSKLWKEQEKKCYVAISSDSSD